MGEHETYQDAIRQGVQSLEACKVTIERFRRAQRAVWERLAGDLLAGMLATLEKALAGLGHTDARVRMAACHVLCHHWKVNSASECADMFAQMAFEDPDAEVRAMAVTALCICYRGTDDLQIGRILANFIHDESQSMRFRQTSYLGLFILRDMRLPIERNPAASLPFAVQFPDQVDWTFVGSFLDETRSDSPGKGVIGVLSYLCETDRMALRAYMAAVTAYERGEYQKSLAHLTESLGLRGDASGGYFLRGRVYARLGRLDEAIADFTRVIESNRWVAKAYYERGQAYTRKGLTSLARLDQEEVVRLQGGPGQ